jgi:uncharacterized damage-inducible protein DinB
MDLSVEFFRHNALMNRRLVDACRHLTREQLGTTAAGTYGTIGATLVHIANSQVGYAARLSGNQRPEGLTEDPFPGFEALAERFALGDAQLEKLAEQAASDRDLQWTTETGGRLQMPASLLLLQAINHGTEHRSQVATMLTQLGVEPPGMDGWAYFLESGQLVQV